MKNIKKNVTIKSKVKGKETPFNLDLNYSEEYDSFNIKVKKGEGFMSYTDSLQSLPLEVVQKLNEMLEEVLIKAGSETEMKEHKMYDGGDFQSGVYAMGGSLQAHGIEVGDTFLKTISGNIQKVKDKNGKIVYLDLSTGKRDTQPTLPFALGGNLFSNAKKIMTPSMKYPKLEGKQVVLKNGKMVQVFTQSGRTLGVMDLNKLGSGASPSQIDITEVETSSYKMGGALVGNQKRIDLNKNGKIDAEDFKLLRSSMDGAWRNERKHVNHSEDYEVRYAKPRPNRTGYKGKRKFEGGGGISNFERLSKVVAKNYEGKRVKPKYQNEYGKVYSKDEAKEVGNKVAGKMKMMRPK